MKTSHVPHPQVVSHLEQSRLITEAAGALAGALQSDLPTAQREADIAYRLGKLRRVTNSPDEKKATERFTAAGEPARERPLLIEDKLLMAVADANVADVLLKASTAADKMSAPTAVDELSHAVQSAEAELAQLEPPTANVQGFRAKAKRRFTSANLTEAGSTFKSQANGAVDKVLKESGIAVTKSFTSVANKKDEIVEAFSKLKDLEELFPEEREEKGLVKLAWERMISALDTLREIVNSESFETALKFLKELKETLNISSLLGKVYQVETLHTTINGLALQAPLEAEVVDGCSSELLALQERYTKLIGNVMTVTRLAAMVVPLATAHVLGPLAGLAYPGVYALSMLAVLLLGRDYLLSGVLNGGVAIQGIVVELVSSATNAQAQG